MKSKNKSKGLKKIVVVLLICTFMATSALTGFLLPGVGKGPTVSQADTGIVKTDNVDHSAALGNLNEDLVTKTKSIDDGETVYYIIETGETSLLSMYENRSDKNVSYQDFISTRSSRINAENMSKKQKAVFGQISKKVDVKFALSLTGMSNAFAVSVRYGDRNLLKEAALASGALSVTISERYDQPQFEIVNNAVPAHDTGIFKRPEGYNYEGEGMVIAVLDTSLDYTHPAFASDAKHLPSVNKEDAVIDTDQLKLKRADVASKLPGLVANGNFVATEDGRNFDLDANMYSKRLDITDVWVNDKVPFAYDYADWDAEVTATQENSHGTHVSGIIAGRSDAPKTDQGGDRYEKDGITPLVGIEGVAPRAQIVAMKVFSDFSGGAEDIFLYGALEDCAKLGVDVVNLSLGRGSGFADMEDNPVQRDSYKLIDALGINLIVAAGNGYSSGMGGFYGANRTKSPDSATVGTPSSMYESFSVASINGVKSKYIKAMKHDGTPETVAYIHESNDSGITTLDFIKDLTEAVTKSPYANSVAYTKADGTQVKYVEGNTLNIPFEAIPGYGRVDDYGSKSVAGKIVLISRGVNTFIEKMKVAKDMGALGAVVYNNAGGLISMSLDKNEIVFPSCSISMDASVKLIEMGTGVFEVSENLTAGPFMSAFSSWGPLPSLELKPDITGHGGEIYSAYPGNNYNRISGTSMAAPNIAGLLLLARQHIENNLSDYGLTAAVTDEQEAVLKKEIQVLTYRLMMSTATMPVNEDSNPYSPRKMGAGLANIQGMLDTEAYIVTKDTRTQIEHERTKLELFDDPERKGVYNMEFTIRNMGTKTLRYNLKTFAFTEDVASNNMVVAEKAFMFDGKTSWTVKGEPVTDGIAVAAPGDTVVTAEVTLSAEDKKYLEKTNEVFVYDENGDYMRDDDGKLITRTEKMFENGMFVEGYLRLDGIDEDTVSLGVPFLGFYGDWNDAPMFEPNIYDVDKDAKNTNKDDAAKLQPQARPLQAYGKFSQDGYDFTLPLGQFLFAVAENTPYNPLYEAPYSTPERTTLSLSKTALFQLYFVAGFLRGAKYSKWEIRDKYTGELMDNGQKVNLRKDARASNIGGLQMELDVVEMGCKNGGTYVFSFDAMLDHYNDYDLDYLMSWDELIAAKKLKEEAGETTGKIESWAFEFTIDTDAPIITDTQVRVEKDFTTGDPKYYLDFYLHDDNYVQAMTFNMYHDDTNDYVSVWNKGVRPILCEKNGTTLVTYEISNSGWQHLVKNGYKISTQVYDYAWNMSHYEINLKKQLYTTAENTLKLGEIGQYREYTRGDSSYTVLESEFDEVIYNEDGTYNEMKEIFIVKNQTVNLGNAIVADKNTWPEAFHWSTDKRSYLTVNPKTGEIFAAASDSTNDMLAIVTVRAYDNSGESKATENTGAIINEQTIKVWIISDKNVQDYGISEVDDNVKNLSSVSFVNISKDVLRAGEEMTVRVEPQPWFGDTTDLVVEWSIEHKNVATIKGRDGDKFEAIITACEGQFDANGEYTPNDSQGTLVYVEIYNKNNPFNSRTKILSISVLPEFVVNGTQLTAYNGTREHVVIPKNLGVTSIADNCFMNNKDIISLELPEGLEVIGRASFAYCGKLESVKMPSTLRTIGEYAFTGSFTPRDGLVTSLQRVDTTACTQPIQVEPKAFINNPALNTNTRIENTKYTIDMFDAGFRIIPASENKLDMSCFRVVGERAFSGAGFLTELDLRNCRTVGENAFSMAGRSANSTGQGAVHHTQRRATTIKLGTRTDTAPNSFAQTGVETLVVPMSRIDESAFAASDYLKEVTFTGANIYIGNSAFNDCPELTTVTFSESESYTAGYIAGDTGYVSGVTTYPYESGSVTYIGQYAFASNPNLTDLTFESTVKYIDDYAFYGAPLASVLDLPVGLEYLGTDAFGGTLNADTTSNSNITTLNIPAGFDSDIENFGALFNTKFETITIDGSPTGSTGRYSLSDGILLKTQTIDSIPHTVMVMVPFLKSSASAFTIPDGVTAIGENAFGFNKNIQSIDLSGITYVAPGAMQNMKSLKSVVWTLSYDKIPAYTFRGCTSLTTVTDTGHVTEIGEYAFAGNVDSLYVTKNATKYEESSKSEAGSFAVTAVEIVPITSIDLTSCIAIGEGAFSATGLTSVVIPDTITEIADYAFFYATKLADVTLHNGVTAIGDFAFYMTALEEVTTGTDGVKTIGNSAFAFDEFEILFYSGSIADGTLDSRLSSNLAEVSFPIATIVGSGAFSSYYGGGALESVNLPKAKEIGAYAFENQSDLDIDDFADLLIVGDYAFASSGMTTITMPKLKYIGIGAFYDCVDMKGEITIPKTVKHIGPLAFAYTEITAFAVVDSSSSYEAINGVLFKNSTFTDYLGNVKQSKELAHYPTGNGRRDINSGIPTGQNGASGLTGGVYVVPEGTTRIGENAFTTVKTVGSVILPSTLTHIGDKAFFGSLVKFYEFKSFKAPILESGSDNFDYGDINDYTWAVYANFYNYFSPTSSYYSWTNADYMLGTGKPAPLGSFMYQFRYNTITPKSGSNSWIYGEYIYSSSTATPLSKIVPDTDTHNAQFGANNSITGGGDLTDRYQYGLVIVRPSNGEGYDDFVYKYYFDSVILSAALMTPDAQEVIDLIAELPAPGEITLANLSSSRIAVTNARNFYEYLRADVKLLIHNYQKLVDCEAAINTILASIKSYMVAFQVDGAIVGKIQTIEQGGKVAMPANPTPATGYAFDGWYLGDQKFDSSTAVNQDMVLVARWAIAENFFKVTFGGIGVDIDTQIVEGDSLAAKPEDPVREGYKFKGWVSEDGKFNFNTKITKDINLYAEWEKKGGCGCGSISLGSGTGLLVVLLFVSAMLALSAAVLIKKRTISKSTTRN